jgi:signal transduction histidine kinase
VEQLGIWDRLRRVDHRIWDALLALLLFTLALVGLFVSPPPAGDTHAPVAFAIALTACGTASLAWRRRSPVIVAAAVVASDAVLSLLGYETLTSVSVAIAAYSVAAYTDRRTLLRALPPLAVIGFLPLVVNEWKPVDALLAVIGDAGIPILLGRMVFNRRVRVVRDRELAARQAVTEERARVARELHDVVAHHMSVMVVQAGAARAVAGKDPHAADEALRHIEESGRAGLAEMRHLLDILKSDRDDEDLGPQPGLGRLDELLASMRATGLSVERVVEGTPRGLPPGVDLSAYRIVQEALTNTLKHASGAHARVLLRFESDVLEVEVVDDGRGALAPSAGDGGRGLVGMRERVQLFGGTFESGPRPGGGFAVRARLPVPEEAPA